jgi:hypothetical protein
VICPSCQCAAVDRIPKSPADSAPSRTHMRGVSRSSRTLGAGCDGRGSVEKTNDTCRVRQSHAVLSPRCWRQARDNASHCAGDGDNKAGLRGEHGISRQPVARGKPDDPAVPVVTYSYAFYFCIRGCGCLLRARLSLRPHLSEGHCLSKLGRHSRRENGDACTEKMETRSAHRPLCKRLPFCYWSRGKQLSPVLLRPINKKERP